MTTSRPYLIRAIHEWILDNAMTPYLLVDIEGEGVDALLSKLDQQVEDYAQGRIDN